jgi:hypothetical protein
MGFQFPSHDESHPPSQSPSGNTYPYVLVEREQGDIPSTLTDADTERAKRRVTRKVLDAFWEDIGNICSSPFLQLMDRGGYSDKARENRERIAKDREDERRSMRRVGLALGASGTSRCTRRRGVRLRPRRVPGSGECRAWLRLA